MYVWCHFSTIFNQRRVLKFAGLLMLCIALITTLFLTVATHAAPGVNQTISFQGRLLDKNGSPVPDGNYNIQFKIYQDGSGNEANNPDGTLEWTETYLNNGGTTGVLVKNGYMSVDLGAKTPFGSQVDWNQDTLWLSMNIAGSSAACTTFGTSPCRADGEMVPMKRLTASPYALNSARLNGKTADDFIHNGTDQQTGNFNISGTGMANSLQGNASVISPLFDSTASGILNIGTVNATAISIGGNDIDQTINIGQGNANKSVAIGSTFGSSSTIIQGGGGGVQVESSGGFAVRLDQSNRDTLAIDSNGAASINLATGTLFGINNASDERVFEVSEAGQITTGTNSSLVIGGSATFTQGLTSKGSVGVLSTDGSNTLGLSSSNDGSTGYLSNTGNTIALQGGALDILTASNNNGQARVSIGNSASSDYALDVTGGANVSDSYAINGVSVLNNSGLNFSGTGTSTVSAASGQTLQLTGDGGVRVGDGNATGEPTLLTIDKAGSTPLASGDALLGSMYYDTTLGKVQCYEADGWGACSSSPDNFVTLSPEYTNAVTNGNGIGQMTTDICSDTLNINDGSTDQPTICGTNETYNFYNWTSPQTTAQTKSIYVTYQLPSNFKKFVTGSTSLAGRTDSTNATVSYQMYKNAASGMVACGTLQEVSTGTKTTWQKVNSSGTDDPAECNFAAGDSVVFKINLTASHDANAYVSTLGFAFSDD